MSMRISDFKGYTSKSDFNTKDPALFSVLEDCIINQGDIVNFPLPIGENLLSGFFHRLFIYYYQQEPYIIVKNNVGIQIARYGPFSSQSGNSFQDVSTPLVGKFDNLLFNYIVSGEYFPRYVVGNTVQAGDWVFLLGQYDAIANNPRMLRIKRNNPSGPTYHAYPIGLKAPGKGIVSPNAVASNGSYLSNQEMQFAFTFHTAIISTQVGAAIAPILPDASNWSPTIDIIDIESNALLTDTIINGGPNLIPQVRIYFNDLNTFLNTPTNLGVYVRLHDQSNFYFIGFINNIHQLTIQAGGYGFLQSIIVNLNLPPLADAQNLDKIAPTTGLTGPILGSHDVPKAANHGIYFKGRVYLATLPDETLSSTYNATNICNRMQVTQRTPAGEIDSGKYANYIEFEEFIGDASERITGFVDFLGQLIIFKEHSTWVLTDDISVGKIELLFSDLGCINALGGQAYISYKDTLYWVAETGVYKYTGGASPRNLMLDLQEDFEGLDKIRLSFSLLKVDPRYDLLTLCMPFGYIGSTDSSSTSYIFSIFENRNRYGEYLGVWTKMRGGVNALEYIKNLSKLSTDPTYQDKNLFQVLAIRGTRLQQLGVLDDAATVPMGVITRFPRFKTGYLQFDAQHRKNHLKFLKIMDRNAGRDNINAIIDWFIAITDIKNTVGPVTTVVTANGEYLASIRSQLLEFQIEITNIDTTDKPFRVSELIIEGHGTGKR